MLMMSENDSDTKVYAKAKESRAGDIHAGGAGPDQPSNHSVLDWGEL